MFWAVHIQRAPHVHCAGVWACCCRNALAAMHGLDCAASLSPSRFLPPAPAPHRPRPPRTTTPALSRLTPVPLEGSHWPHQAWPHHTRPTPSGLPVLIKDLTAVRGLLFTKVWARKVWARKVWARKVWARKVWARRAVSGLGRRFSRHMSPGLASAAANQLMHGKPRSGL